MNPETAARKIKSMEVRGALNIALCAADSLKEFSQKYTGKNYHNDFKKQANILKKARPTAVSLPNTVDYLLYIASKSSKEEMPLLIDVFVKKQEDALKTISQIGAKRIKSGDTVLTHCNSSTALEVIREAAKTKKINVICTETRPRNQGYLSAAFMAKHKIPVTLIVDSAARYAFEEFDIDKVVVGADTVAANGAVANKIGTSQIATIAKEFNVPVIVACEAIKFSPQTYGGEMIPIEERDHAEIRSRMKGVKMWNPAFDFTPPEDIDVIVTEDGVISPHMAYEILKKNFAWEMK